MPPLMLLNKIDLLPHRRFRCGRLSGLRPAGQPDIEILQLSARTGEGMDEAWLDWLRQGQQCDRPGATGGADSRWLESGGGAGASWRATAG
jgi:hypothetical protein